jgi:hypothetical protein
MKLDMINSLPATPLLIKTVYLPLNLIMFFDLIP